MAYAYDASLLDRIKPRISQWEATTGRKISPSMLDALMKGQLSAEVDKASATRALDIQEGQIATQKEQQEKANKAAMVKGGVDILTTGATLGLTAKALSKPSAMSELLAYQKSLGGTTAAVPGAQTVLAGGMSPVGAQVVQGGAAYPGIAGGTSALGQVGPMSAVGEAAIPAAVPGAGSALLSSAGPIAAAYGAQYLTGKMAQPYLDKAGFSMAGKGWTYAGLPGATIGATVDLGKKGYEAVKDIGSDIGDIFGW